MGLFDFITNKVKNNALTNYANSVKNKTLDPNASIYKRLLGEEIGTDDIDYAALKGVDRTMPEYRENMGLDKNDTDPMVNISISNPQRYGGLLNDLAAGYKENRINPISLNNFGDNDIAFNRKKGFGYRLGEGLGSIARVGESPLGRGLLTGAAIALLGGSPAEALAYGGTATALNQGNRGRDALYRNQLEGEGIDTSGISGYITDDTYKSMLAAKQMKDNAEYRNTLLTNQQEQNKIANQFRRDQAERQAKQDEFNKNIQLQRLGLGYANLSDRQQARAEANKTKNNDLKSIQDGLTSLYAVEKQLQNYQDMFKTLPGKLHTYTIGKLAEKTGMQNEKQVEFESRTNLLFNKIARDLGGEKGVLSDQDIARVKDSMPKYTDSLGQKNAKMKAINDLLTIAKEKYQYRLSTMAIPVEANYDNDGWAF